MNIHIITTDDMFNADKRNTCNETYALASAISLESQIVWHLEHQCRDDGWEHPLNLNGKHAERSLRKKLYWQLIQMTPGRTEDVHWVVGVVNEIVERLKGGNDEQK